jgi:hypothetical protein
MEQADFSLPLTERLRSLSVANPFLPLPLPHAGGGEGEGSEATAGEGEGMHTLGMRS